MSDMREYLARQCAVSREKFGPSDRTLGVQDHIMQEFDEINHAETNEEAAAEWTDVAILALDGLLRSTREMVRESVLFDCQKGVIVTEAGTVVGHDGEPTNDFVAAVALELLTGKQAKNELRDFGDWRTAAPDKAMNHKRGIHD